MKSWSLPFFAQMSRGFASAAPTCSNVAAAGEFLQHEPPVFRPQYHNQIKIWDLLQILYLKKKKKSSAPFGGPFARFEIINPTALGHNLMSQCLLVDSLKQNSGVHQSLSL